MRRNVRLHSQRRCGWLKARDVHQVRLCATHQISRFGPQTLLVAGTPVDQYANIKPDDTMKNLTYAVHYSGLSCRFLPT
jgi:hypothetical protein